MLRGEADSKGFGYIEFRDVGPVGGAVQVGVHGIKMAVLEAKRGLSREQQEHAGGQSQGASAGRSSAVPDLALDSEQGPPGVVASRLAQG